MRSLIITEKDAGQRLDKLLGKYLNLAGKSFIYKMLRKKNITLNGKKCDGSEKLSCGDEVKLFLAEETIEKFSEVKVQKVRKQELDILYEDEHIALINISRRLRIAYAGRSSLRITTRVGCFTCVEIQIPVERMASLR